MHVELFPKSCLQHFVDKMSVVLRAPNERSLQLLLDTARCMHASMLAAGKVAMFCTSKMLQSKIRMANVCLSR